MKYNESQLKVINSLENNIIVTAPAGSGKTSSIVGAVEKYKQNNPNDKVVIVTFTKKATAELMSRIKFLDVSISTIHSWSYGRLKLLSEKYNFKIQLLEDEAIKEILKVLSRGRKQYYLNQLLLFTYIMGNYNIDIDDKIKRVFEIIRHDYIEFKRTKRLYDFTDLPLYLYDVMREYGEIICDIDALFVDEFQDVDPVQLEVFSLVQNTKKKVYIGDPKQSIYVFRGAVEEIFDNLEDFTKYYLDVNYRSYQKIIDYAGTVRELGKKALKHDNILDLTTCIFYEKSDILCNRGDGGSIYVAEDIGDCVELFGEKTKSRDEAIIIKVLMADPNTQILCRSNKQVKKIKSLGIENVSTIHQAKGLEYDNVILIGFAVDTLEEMNVAYVAMTRAKNNLLVVNYQTFLYHVVNENIQSPSNNLF